MSRRFMRGRTHALSVAAVVTGMLTTGVGRASADVITDWNNTTAVIGGPQIQRTWAMVHAAMFDAINAILGGYRPYQADLPAAPPGASAEAAAAAAARGVLVRLFPARVADLDAALASSTAAIPAGAAKSDGLAFGDSVAARLVQARLDDGILTPGPTYTSTNAPGDYQLTPGAPPQPVNTNAANWRPFVLRSAAQYRPSGPYPLGSAAYARDLAETRRWGVATDSERTPAEDLVARWALEQGQFQANRIARTEAVADGRPLLEHARFFALLNFALADATMAVFEAKYFYRAWRPLTAIHRADEDGNARTATDAAWTPFLTTPPHPEYPAAHGSVSQAAAGVLSWYFGRHYGFVGTSTGVPGVTRGFESFDAWVDDATIARIYGGMHFRRSLDAGRWQGARVARWVLRHTLRRVADRDDEDEDDEHGR